MSVSSFILVSKEFETETAQIHYWCNSLNDVKKQLSNLYSLSAKQKKYLCEHSKEISLAITSFTANAAIYSKDPSNLYYLTTLLLSLLEEPFKRNDNGFQALSPIFQTNIPQLTSSIDMMILNIQNTSQEIMTEVSLLKSQSSEIQKKYQKSKDMLDEAQLKKKKIDSDPMTIYNDKVKEKAEINLINSVQEVENIIPQVKIYSQKLEFKKEIFNQHMKDTFELVILHNFKGIAHLHQFFYLLAKHRNDFYVEMKQFLNDKIRTSMKQNSLIINDYSERKYAESMNIIYEPIHFTNVTIKDEYDNISTLSLIDSYLKYTEMFYSCTKIRKRIAMLFTIFLHVFIKSENIFIDNLYKNQSKTNDVIKTFEYLSKGTKKIWNMFGTYWNAIELHYTTFSKYLASRGLHLFKTYRKETKKDYKIFRNNWTKYEKKLQSFKYEHKKNELLKEKNKDNTSANAKFAEKEIKIKEFIKRDCYDFVNQNVKRIRERDRKRTNEIVDFFENGISMIEKEIEENIEFTQNIIDSIMQIDFFEEVKELFTQYFERFNISNYDNFLDMIKVKALNKIDFENDVLSQSTKKQLGLSNNNNNINSNNNLFNSNSFLNDNQNQSFLSSDINNDTLLGNHNMNNIEQSSSAESEDMDKISESENIEFVNKNNFQFLEHKNINPYKNFKENEIKKIMSKLKEEDVKESDTEAEYVDNIVTIEKDEKFIDKYPCVYKQTNSFRGLLYLTNKKIVFYSQKIKISIPMSDIVSVSKHDKDKKRPHMIEVKTKKATLYFYSFKDRDNVIKMTNEQIASLNENSNKDQGMEGDNSNNKNSKYSCQLYQRNIEMNNLLKKIRFSERLVEINESRMKEFATEFRTNMMFMKQSDFHMSFIDNDLLTTSPINLVYHTLFNPDNAIEVLGQGKGFLESLSINRGDINVSMKKEGNMNNIPKFFEDMDYANNVFSSIEEKELELFLSEVSTWPKVATYEINFVHPIKMIVGPDSITMRNVLNIYFISPTQLIIDYHSYGSNFPFTDCFVSIIQYCFNTEYKFNLMKGIFEFNTYCSIYFNITFIKSCIFESTVKSEGYHTTEEETKYKVYESMKLTMENECANYNEMYIKLCNENIRKNLHKYSANLPEGIDINLEDQLAEEEEKKKKEAEQAEQKLKQKQLNEKKQNEANIENKDKKLMIYFSLMILIYLIFKLYKDRHEGKLEILFNSLLIIFDIIIFITFWKKKS